MTPKPSAPSTARPARRSGVAARHLGLDPDQYDLRSDFAGPLSRVEDHASMATIYVQVSIPCIRPGREVMFRRCKGPAGLSRRPQSLLRHRRARCPGTASARWSSARPAFPSTRAARRCSRGETPWAGCSCHAAGCRLSPHRRPISTTEGCTCSARSGQRPRDRSSGAQIDGPLRCLLRRLPELRCRRSQGDLRHHLPRQMEPWRAKRRRVRLQGHDRNDGAVSL